MLLFKHSKSKNPVCCRVHIHIRYTPGWPSPGRDVAAVLWCVVFSLCFAAVGVSFCFCCCILPVKYCFYYVSLLICCQYIEKMWYFGVSFDQMVNFQVMDAQTLAQNNPSNTTKKSYILCPIPSVLLSDIHLAKHPATCTAASHTLQMVPLILNDNFWRFWIKLKVT